VLEGVIKELDEITGMGYIKTDKIEKLFFHKTGLCGMKFKDLKVDDRVTFEILIKDR